MPVQTQANTLGDALKWEQSGDFSREKVVVASGNSVVATEVVAKLTADGKVVPLNPAGADGSEAAVGFMVGDVDASSADKAGVIIALDAWVAMDNLVWPDGISAGEKTTAIAELEALRIKAAELA